MMNYVDGKNANMNKTTPISLKWKCGPAIYLVSSLLILIAIIGVINSSLGVSIFFGFWGFLVILHLLMTPRRIIVHVEKVEINYFGRTTIILKKNIKKISKFRYPPCWYYVRIIQNRGLKKNGVFEKLPIVVYGEQKPYYNLKPSKAYDIVEEIENWLQN